MTQLTRINCRYLLSSAVYLLYTTDVYMLTVDKLLRYSVDSLRVPGGQQPVLAPGALAQHVVQVEGD